MRFYHDSPQTLRKVVWYFVPDSRETLPYETSFGSQIYNREEEPERPIGERFDPVPWRGGDAPCDVPASGTCGTKEQWESGLSIEDHAPATWPGTNVNVCCALPLLGNCGGLAIGRAGFGACHMTSSCDIYSPFGAALPSATNVPIQFVEDLLNGRGTSPLNTVAWTHYMDVAVPTAIFDGVTRTAGLDSLDYADGDEVRIPTGGSTRYVVVWVTLCDTEGTVVKRVFLMRHAV